MLKKSPLFSENQFKLDNHFRTANHLFDTHFEYADVTLAPVYTRIALNASQLACPLQ